MSFEYDEEFGVIWHDMSDADNEQFLPLMKEMSLKIERLEAELRSATQKAARHEGQAEAYKQKAEAHKREAEALRQDVEALRQGVEALKQEAKAHKQEVAICKRETAVARQEAEVLKSDLVRVKATLAEKLEAEEFEQKQCTVCLEHPAHVVALPCGHRCFCTNEECSAHVSLCPLCREPIIGTLRIY
jgi:chromosome segregation ATPase